MHENFKEKRWYTCRTFLSNIFCREDENMNEQLLQKARAAKNAEELMAIAKENGVEMTEEEAQAYFAQLIGFFTILSRCAKRLPQPKTFLTGCCGKRRSKNLPPHSNRCRSRNVIWSYCIIIATWNSKKLPRVWVFLIPQSSACTLKHC